MTDHSETNLALVSALLFGMGRRRTLLPHRVLGIPEHRWSSQPRSLMSCSQLLRNSGEQHGCYLRCTHACGHLSPEAQSSETGCWFLLSKSRLTVTHRPQAGLSSGCHYCGFSVSLAYTAHIEWIFLQDALEHLPLPCLSHIMPVQVFGPIFFVLLYLLGTWTLQLTTQFLLCCTCCASAGQHMSHQFCAVAKPEVINHFITKYHSHLTIPSSSVFCHAISKASQILRFLSKYSSSQMAGTLPWQGKTCLKETLWCIITLDGTWLTEVTQRYLYGCPHFTQHLHQTFTIPKIKQVLSSGKTNMFLFV